MTRVLFPFLVVICTIVQAYSLCSCDRKIRTLRKNVNIYANLLWKLKDERRVAEEIMRQETREGDKLLRRELSALRDTVDVLVKDVSYGRVDGRDVDGEEVWGTEEVVDSVDATAKERTIQFDTPRQTTNATSVPILRKGAEPDNDTMDSNFTREDKPGDLDSNEELSPMIRQNDVDGSNANDSFAKMTPVAVGDVDKATLNRFTNQLRELKREVERVTDGVTLCVANVTELRRDVGLQRVTDNVDMCVSNVTDVIDDVIHVGNRVTEMDGNITVALDRLRKHVGGFDSCDPPTFGDNTVVQYLNTSITGGHTFPHRAKFFIRCRSRFYSMIGRDINTVTCENSRWSSAMPSCELCNHNDSAPPCIYFEIWYDHHTLTSCGYIRGICTEDDAGVLRTKYQVTLKCVHDRIRPTAMYKDHNTTNIASQSRSNWGEMVATVRTTGIYTCTNGHRTKSIHVVFE